MLDIIRIMDIYVVYILMDDILCVVNNVIMNSFLELVDNRLGNVKKY